MHSFYRFSNLPAIKIKSLKKIPSFLWFATIFEIIEFVHYYRTVKNKEFFIKNSNRWFETIF